jgi:hypothetical protein
MKNSEIPCPPPDNYKEGEPLAKNTQPTPTSPAYWPWGPKGGHLENAGDEVRERAQTRLIMAKKDSGLVWSNPFNETGSGGPESPDITGDKLYYSYEEVMATHLKETGQMVSTPNSDASHDVYGGPAAGEMNPAGMGGKGGGKK